MVINTLYDINDVVYGMLEGRLKTGVIYQIKINVYSYGVDIYYLIRETTTGEIVTLLEPDTFLTAIEVMDDLAKDNGLTGCVSP